MRLLMMHSAHSITAATAAIVTNVIHPIISTSVSVF
jgi:hypothetical protein